MQTKHKCEGKSTLLTVIDIWTGWPEAFPMTMQGEAVNAKACAKLLVHQWIPILGMPDIITLDRGSQCVSDLWLQVCNLMRIARDPTTSYHPQHNWKVERMHRCLKKLTMRPFAWHGKMACRVIMGDARLRAATNLNTGVSPFIIVTGQQPTLPGQLVVQRANIDNASVFGRELTSAMAVQRFIENPWHRKAKMRTHVPQDLWKAKKVLVRVDKVQPSLEQK